MPVREEINQDPRNLLSGGFMVFFHGYSHSNTINFSIHYYLFFDLEVFKVYFETMSMNLPGIAD